MKHRASYRVRPAGMVFLGACIFVMIAMRNSGTNLLYFVFGLMMGALVASFILPALTLRKLSVRRQFSDHIVAGEPADIVYHFTNAKRFWPTMAVAFEEVHDALDPPPPIGGKPPGAFVLHIPQRGAASVAAEIVARRRGQLELATLRLSTAFPFGFLLRTIQVECPQSLIVYPRIGLLNRHLALAYRESIETGTMTSNVRGGADEFYGLREYRPGDNTRGIHWRSTARRGQLMIREMAANAPPQMIVILNLRAGGPPEAIERAIEIAASLICYGYFENFAVGLAIAGVDTDLPPAPHMGRDARAQLLKRLAVLDPALIRPNAGIVYPSKLAGRAEWIIVTLHQSDEWRDLVSPNGGAGGGGGREGLAGGGGGAIGNTAMEGRGSAMGGGRGKGQHTVLALDAPGSESWVHFLSPDETLRLLRDRGADTA